MTNTELENLTSKLLELGEDPAELEMWRGMYGSLDAAEQEALLANLRREIEDLEKAG